MKHNIDRALIHVAFAALAGALLAVPQALEIVTLDTQTETIILLAATVLGSFFRPAEEK